MYDDGLVRTFEPGLSPWAAYHALCRAFHNSERLSGSVAKSNRKHSNDLHVSSD